MGNIFKDNGEAEEGKDVSEDPSALGLADVCPFLTCNSLAMIQVDKGQQLRGAPPVQPALAINLSPCIKECCKFYSAERKDCVLKLFMESSLSCQEKKS